MYGCMKTWVARLDTDGFDSPITCVEKTVYMNGNSVCQSARAGLSYGKQRFPPSKNSSRESSVSASICFWCKVHLGGCRRAMEKAFLLTELSPWDLPLLPQRAWVPSPVDDGATGARLPAVFALGVTASLLFLLPPPGRTGLLADLLPSFAVEIMPGTQSFHSLFA